MVKVFLDKESCDTALQDLQTLPAGAVVVCPDSQERCGEDSWLVFEVVDDPEERVLQRGLFWNRGDAEVFATAYVNLTRGLQATWAATGKTARCVVCRAEFNEEEITAAFEAGKTGCPACGDTGLPMAIAQDMLIRINWHELRILTIWADNYARQHKDNPGMAQSIAAIVKALEMQRPSGEFAALTIAGELQELANHSSFSEIEVVEPDGTRRKIEKKPVQ